MPPRSQIEREIASVVDDLPWTSAQARSRGSSAGRSGRRATGSWRGSRVQVLLFDAGKWTERQAVSWARRHGFSVKKIHRTEHYIRIRQFDPTPGAPKRTIRFGRDPDELGIRAIVEAT